MTGSSQNFVSYILCVGNEKIKIADGSLAPIAGKGQNFPFKGLSLQNVLHVPKISYNLLSISNNTRKLNCKATFLSDFVSFQDLSSMRVFALPDIAGDSISLTMIPSLVVALGLVSLYILIFLNKIVCCGISSWVTQTLNI